MASGDYMAKVNQDFINFFETNNKSNFLANSLIFKNEALRMFLAVSALVLTALLTSPALDNTSNGNSNQALRKSGNQFQTEKIASRSVETKVETNSIKERPTKHRRADKKIKLENKYNRNFKNKSKEA